MKKKKIECPFCCAIGIKEYTVSDGGFLLIEEVRNASVAFVCDNGHLWARLT